MPIARTYTVEIHVNRHRMAEGLPWTLHFRGECIPAAHFDVVGRVRIESRERPDKATQPRYTLVAIGVRDVRPAAGRPNVYLLIGKPRHRGGPRMRNWKASRPSSGSSD
jgi:hypothetical protein